MLSTYRECMIDNEVENPNERIINYLQARAQHKRETTVRKAQGGGGGGQRTERERGSEEVRMTSQGLLERGA